MKKVFFLLILFVIIISYYSIIDVYAENEGVVFYDNIGCTGESTTVIPEGNYLLYESQDYGFKSNWASSVKIPTGFTLRLFTGTSIDPLVLTQEDENSLDFSRFGADNLVSGFEVRKGITFYSNAGYKLDSTLGIKEGFYTLDDLKDFEFQNDWVSSVSIPKGWSVVLYEHNNFDGKRWMLGQMDKNSADFENMSSDNKISSIQVIGVDKKIVNFKSMGLHYEKKVEGLFPWDPTYYFCRDEIYFNDKELAYKFADTLTFTNEENWINYGISTIVGFLPQGGIVLGPMLAAVFTLEGNERNTVAANLKKSADDGNGKAYWTTYYTLDGDHHRIDNNNNLWADSWVWDGTTIYGKQGGGQYVEVPTSASYPITGVKFIRSDNIPIFPDYVINPTDDNSFETPGTTSLPSSEPATTSSISGEITSTPVVESSTSPEVTPSNSLLTLAPSQTAINEGNNSLPKTGEGPNTIFYIIGLSIIMIGVSIITYKKFWYNN